MTAIAPYRPDAPPGRDGFWQLLHAEWTKFRTVRGWVIGMIVAVLAGGGIGLLGAGSAQSGCQGTAAGAQAGGGQAACGAPSFPLGPGGEPVTDSFYFVRHPLTGDGSITVRVASMTGLLPSVNSSTPNPTRPGLEEWAKAGIIIKQNLNPGSAYAAMMVTAGHGVRMQWNYTGDTAGLPGAVGPGSPRWLRLTRSGDVVTGYDSADGTHWTEVGRVVLSGLPRAVQAGLFAASPDDQHTTLNFGGGTSSGGGGATEATAAFDHVSAPGGAWTGEYMGGPPEEPGTYGYHQAGGRYTVTGSGDIAPVPEGHGGPLDSAITLPDYLIGTFVALIALGVVAAMFMAAEYRRSLIRTTLTASPRRGRVLAAKAVVVAAVSFAAGVAGAALAVVAGSAITHARGYYEFPSSGGAEVRVILGTGLLAAVVAVLALAVGTIVRRGAAAVAIVVVGIVLPFFLAVAAIVPLSAASWLLRITPAAGFALQSAYPRYGQVRMIYSALSGYYPLPAWAGLLVLCGWTAAALAAAACLLRRRDA